MGILFAAIVVLGFPSLRAIFFGMAIFCAFKDHTSKGNKVMWFLLFLGTSAIGSTVYYFAVYRGYIKRKSASDAGRESLPHLTC